MKLSRNHLSVLGAAAKERDGRPILSSVYAHQEDGQTVAVATDSYRLYSVSEAMQEGEEASEGIMIPLEQVKFAAVLIKPHKYLNHLEVTSEQISVNGTTHKIEPRDGKFPDYKSVLPKSEPLATVKINPKYLKEAMEFFKGAQSITLEFHEDNKPVIIRTDDTETKKLAVIMPMRG